MTTDGKHVQTGGRAGRDKDNEDRKKRFIVRGGDRKKKYSHAKEKTEENRRKKERPRQSKRDKKKGGMTSKNANNEGKVEIERGGEKEKRRIEGKIDNTLEI